VLDPHTAVGVNAATRLIHQSGAEGYTVSLSTAHPCKFAKAVNDALENMDGYNWDGIIPADVQALLGGKEQRVRHIPKADAESIKKVIAERVSRA
jgi:threonine synthase